MPHLAHGRALIIGVGTYLDSKIQSVPQTAREAEQIAAALQDERVAAYAPAHVTLLTHQQTTREKILAALQALAEHARPDDTVFIFFSGHGAWGDDGVYYFGTHDVELAARGRFKAHTGLSQTELLERLREIRARKILLVVNACFSGALNPMLDAAPTQPPFGAPPSERVLDELLASGEGRAIITASRDAQPSRFDWNEPHTFFGQALLDGLRGNEIATRSGYIGLAELYEFIYACVLARTHAAQPPQEPMLSLVRGVGTFPIAFARGVNAPTDASLLQPISSASKGVRVVELHLEQNIGAGNQGINVQAGGDVTVGGDVVGRDKIVAGDEVHGDKVLGDKYVVIQNGKPKTEPQPRLLTREWWRWIRRNPKWMFLYVFASVAFLVTLSACVGFPTVEGWKPISEQNLGGNAKWIFRIGETLFVTTETNGKCNSSLDPGLFKSVDRGKSWKPFPIALLNYEGGQGCDRSSIEAIVESPETRGLLYAATANVGLLVSRDNGEKWEVLDDALARRQLSGLVVLLNPERLFVAARNGLYRSTDFKNWSRLDAADVCRTPGFLSLPEGAAVSAHLVSMNNNVFIAPRDLTDEPYPEADIYYSEDGGDCWKRVHAAETQQDYSALAVIPDSTIDILFATWDLSGIGFGRRVWRWQPTMEKEEPLANLPLGIHQLYVDATNQKWYASTPFGFIFRGSVNSPNDTQQLAGPSGIYAAFTSDFEPGPPLLLKRGNVFRLGTVGWWQGIFP